MYSNEMPVTDTCNASWFRRSTGATCLLLVFVCGFAGCGDTTSVELAGEAAMNRLPKEVIGIVPADAILCHEEEKEEGGYHLWILRKPGGTWLQFPKKKGLENHSMPLSALESILQSKLPSLDRGTPVGKRCQYTHWLAADGAEIQVREILTDQGWFASLERVRM